MVHCVPYGALLLFDRHAGLPTEPSGKLCTRKRAGLSMVTDRLAYRLFGHDDKFTLPTQAMMLSTARSMYPRLAYTVLVSEPRHIYRRHPSVRESFTCDVHADASHLRARDASTTTKPQL